MSDNDNNDIDAGDEFPPASPTQPEPWEKEVAHILTAIQKKESEDKLAAFCPYPKQAEVLNLTATKHEVACIGGNKIGKSYMAAMYLAGALTGRWWKGYKGRRWAGPVNAWCCGETRESLRDNMQELLFGPDPDNPGVGGAIPKAAIIGKPIMGRGVQNAIDYCLIRHRDGGVSRISFKPYSLGRKVLQGPNLDLVAVDEQPEDFDSYLEICARTTGRSGTVLCTFTPLLGHGGVVARFMDEPNADRGYINASIYDALHFSDAERQRIIDLYPAWQRRARVFGEPLAGEGLIFDFSPDLYLCNPIRIEPWWPRICGVDFGIGHPQAAVWMAKDPNTNIRYAYDCYKQQDVSALVHADAIKQRDPHKRIPIAWPHDGLQRSKATEDALVETYRRAGLRMLGEPARDDAGTNALEPNVMRMRDALRNGTLKIFSSLQPLVEEMRLYHWKDGKIVPINDDAISACRYAFMCIDRFGRAEAANAAPPGQTLSGAEYSKLYRRQGRGVEGNARGIVDIDVWTGRPLE